MSGERPNLDLARAYTRAVGPTAIAVGAAIALQGLFLLPTVVAQYQPLAYGLVMMLFGTAAYARTESVMGRIAQWCVTLVFVAGGVWSLLQWVPLIWGPQHVGASGDLSLIALWLTAGPALFVPGLLAAVRPGWTPLIVVPALLSIAFAAMMGYGALYMLGLPNGAQLSSLEHAQLVGISGFSAIFLLIAVFRAITMWRS
ncbi:MAG: hypothetical protein IPG73_12245 [Ignavibacteria bacterium]|nr:hypothetical protein [Ignavibacteria bacterium]MBK6761451.1 hypothetical protein [Ignavibacteria bacterium]